MHCLSLMNANTHDPQHDDPRLVRPQPFWNVRVSCRGGAPSIANLDYHIHCAEALHELAFGLGYVARVPADGLAARRLLVFEIWGWGREKPCVRCEGRLAYRE